MGLRPSFDSSLRGRFRSLVAATASVCLVGAGAVGIVAHAATPAGADTVGPINFESYATGTVNSQDGWTSTGAFDHKIVVNAGAPASFQTKSLRISDAVTSGSFGDQTFSKSVVNAAGEPGADDGGFPTGTLQDHFNASFDFASFTGAYQPGLHMSVSPDRGDGARMSYVRIEDSAGGWNLTFDDYRDVDTLGSGGNLNDGCTGSDDFTDIPIATNVSRAVPHNLEFSMHLIPGPHNDIVAILLDGHAIYTGTSWEDYYRYCAESGGGTGGAFADQSRIVRNVLFRTSGTATPANLNKGFLVDNLENVSANADCTTICYVNTATGNDAASGNALDPLQTIQRGVNKVNAGGTVSVSAGTYVENVIVPKSVVVTGAGNSTVVEPAITGYSCGSGSLCPGASNVFLVQSSNVTIDHLKIEGDNPLLAGGASVGGANVDARNGIITDHTLATQFLNLSVHDVTISDVYLRGVYASTPNGTFNFTNNTVNNVQGDPGSIGLFAFTSGGVMTGNHVSAANDAISANHSTGISFTNNVVTGSGSGVHTDNAGETGGPPDVLSGNNVSACTVGGYGVWAFVPYLSPTISNNTVSGCDVGLAAFASCTLGGVNICAGGVVPTVLFTGNNVSNYGPTGAGLYISTNSFGFGDGQVRVNADHNLISGPGEGVVVEETGGAVATTSITRNSLASNPTFGIDNLGTTTVQATCNWWGSASGPGPVGPGSGSKVTANVQYNGWLSSSNLNGGCPNAPTITQIALNDATSVIVSFTALNTGIPRTFTVTCVSLTGNPTVSASGPGSPITVGGLVQGAPYQCTVTETNPGGTSAPSGPGLIIPGVSGPGNCKEVPSAPRNLSTAPGNASATVSWAPPVTDGCIAGYIVTPYIGSVAQTSTLIPGHGTTTVVKGLTNGQSYRFTVAAENGSVVGPASDYTVTVTAGAPQAATALKAVKVGKGALKLTFKVPASNGAPIKSYTATCKSSNGGTTRVKKATKGPITVTGLSAGKIYTCAVRATNSRGTGPASRASGAVKA